MSEASLKARVRAFLKGGEPGRLVWLAPVIFAVHVLEEAPRFVEWASGTLSVGITDSQFVAVNVTGLVATVLIVAVLVRSWHSAAWLLATAWFSFMMAGNAILHLGATLYLRAYAPGVVTALVLYVPFYVWFVDRLVGRSQLRVGAICIAIVIGILPMLAHGYLLLFAGTSLWGVW